jgi:hypothetical protein
MMYRKIQIMNGANHREGPQTPRWVKAFGIFAVALILLFVALHLTGHGMHGH